MSRYLTAVRAAKVDAGLGTNAQSTAGQQCSAAPSTAPPYRADQHRLCQHGRQQDAKLPDDVQRHVLQGEPMDVRDIGPWPRTRASRHRELATGCVVSCWCISSIPTTSAAAVRHGGTRYRPDDGCGRL
uniref:Uncharacterized protein n=1 Tax=Anopheles maculatus TaxID=74869 RepID=A0A182SSF9_9DIPT